MSLKKLGLNMTPVILKGMALFYLTTHRGQKLILHRNSINRASFSSRWKIKSLTESKHFPLMLKRGSLVAAPNIFLNLISFHSQTDFGCGSV